MGPLDAVDDVEMGLKAGSAAPSTTQLDRLEPRGPGDCSAIATSERLRDRRIGREEVVDMDSL